MCADNFLKKKQSRHCLLYSKVNDRNPTETFHLPGFYMFKIQVKCRI